jgi:hypothetical protein
VAPDLVNSGNGENIFELALGGGRQRFGEQGVEEAAARGGGGGQARFEAVAERHQRVDLGDDAVLFGEGWEGNWKYFPFPLAYYWKGACSSFAPSKVLKS